MKGIKESGDNAGKTGFKIVAAATILITGIALLVSLIFYILINFLCNNFAIIKVICGGVIGLSDGEYVAKYHMEGQPVYNRDVINLVYGDAGIVEKIENLNEGIIVHKDEARSIKFKEKEFDFGKEVNLKVVPVLDATSVYEQNKIHKDKLKLEECRTKEYSNALKKAEKDGAKLSAAQKNSLKEATEKECKDNLHLYILEDDGLRRGEGASAGGSPSSNSEVSKDENLILVNKENGIGEKAPTNLVIPNVTFNEVGDIEKNKMEKEAAEALEKLFKAAKKDAYNLVAVSGYRSYERQKEVYQGHVNNKGVAEADRISAKPGNSEHQTGLAMDISSKSNGFKLNEAFGSSNEGKWVSKNAHKYGFVIRYPSGKEAVTGYSYEPWHLRYVGVGPATEMKNNNQTLEEYLKASKPASVPSSNKVSATSNQPSNPTPSASQESDLGSGNEIWERLYTLDLSKATTEFKTCINSEKRKNAFVKYGKMFGIDPVLLAALCGGESSGNSNVVSYAGAKGLMQIMPGSGSAIDKSYNFSTGTSSLPLVFSFSDFTDDEKSIEKAARLLNEYTHIVKYDVAMTMIGYNRGVYGFRKDLGGASMVEYYANNPSDKSYVNKLSYAKDYLHHMTEHVPPGVDVFILGRDMKIRYLNSADIQSYQGDNLIAGGVSGGINSVTAPDFHQYNFAKLYFTKNKLEKNTNKVICTSNKESVCGVEYFDEVYIERTLEKQTTLEHQINKTKKPLDITHKEILESLTNVSQGEAIAFLEEKNANSKIHVQDSYTTDVEMLIRAMVSFNRVAVSYDSKSFDVAIAGSLLRLQRAIENEEKGRTEEKSIEKMKGEKNYALESYQNELAAIQWVIADYTDNKEGTFDNGDEGQVKKAVEKLLKPNGGNYVSFLNHAQLNSILIPAYMYAKGEMDGDIPTYPSYEEITTVNLQSLYEKYVEEKEVPTELINAWLVGKYFERNAAKTYHIEHSSMWEAIAVGANNKEIIMRNFTTDISYIRNIMEHCSTDEETDDCSWEDENNVTVAGGKDIDGKMRNALIQDMFIKFALYPSNEDAMEIGEFVKISCVTSESSTSQSCIDYNVVSIEGYGLEMKASNIFTQTTLTVNQTTQCFPPKIVYNPSDEGSFVKTDSGGVAEYDESMGEDVARFDKEVIPHVPAHKATITGSKIEMGGEAIDGPHNNEEISLFEKGFNYVAKAFDKVVTNLDAISDKVVRAWNALGLKAKGQSVAEYNPYVYEKDESVTKHVNLTAEFLQSYGGNVYTKNTVNVAKNYRFTALMQVGNNYKSSAAQQNNLDNLIKGIHSLVGGAQGKVELRDARGTVIGYVSESGSIFSGEFVIPALNRVINFSYDYKTCPEGEVADLTYTADISAKATNIAEVTKTLEGLSILHSSEIFKGKINDVKSFNADLLEFYRQYTNVGDVENQEFLDAFDLYMTGQTIDGTQTVSAASSTENFAGGAVADLDGFEVGMPMVEGSTFTSGYSTNRNCGGLTRCSTSHLAYDIDRVDGDYALAMIDGVVVEASSQMKTNRGRYVVLEHTKEVNGVTKKIYTLYQHLTSYNVSVGDSVSRGDALGVIGRSGAGGDVYAAIHLHVEFSNSIRGPGLNVNSLLKELNKGKYQCLSGAKELC